MKLFQKLKLTAVLSALALIGLHAIQPALPALSSLPGHQPGVFAPTVTSGHRVRLGKAALEAWTPGLTQALLAAHSPKLSNAAANASANAFTALLNSGYLKLYDGSQAATADTAVSGQTLCATLRFSSTAFGSASGGVSTANTITSDTDAAATCTTTWFRTLESDNATVTMDGSTGTSGADINLSTVSIVQHATVAVTAFTYTQSKS